MDHIKNNLDKYSEYKSKSTELDSIRKKIIEITGISPVSLKIKNETLYIRANNNYEALELRMKISSLEKSLDFQEIKIV
jgi:hypothetical protein